MLDSVEHAYTHNGFLPYCWASVVGEGQDLPILYCFGGAPEGLEMCVLGRGGGSDKSEDIAAWYENNNSAGN